MMELCTMDPNSNEALRRRLHAGTLTCGAPTLMLFARAAFAVAAQGLVAGIFVLRSWRASGRCSIRSCR
jgi:anti-sigma factor RsiW